MHIRSDMSVADIHRAIAERRRLIKTYREEAKACREMVKHHKDWLAYYKAERDALLAPPNPDAPKPEEGKG